MERAFGPEEEDEDQQAGGEREATGEGVAQGGDGKRRKLNSSETYEGFRVGAAGPGEKVDGDRGEGVGENQVEKRARGGREDKGEEEEEEEEDMLPWQVPFVMGRVCARLGRHPQSVLDNLSQALRLAKVKTSSFFL